MKTILVPTYLSPLPDQALALAAEISRKISASITSVHVIESHHRYKCMKDPSTICLLINRLNALKKALP